jgi:2-(1,2-epoxy-1,2-dihydrophenyl)acetyl-CoA isomerase
MLKTHAAGVDAAPPAVLIERHHNVAYITLNRPAVLNALNEAMLNKLVHAFQTLSTDKDIGCVVLRGAGDGFMAGGDIKEFRTQMELPEAERLHVFQSMLARVGLLVEAMRAMPQPVIASVHGAAAGFGMSLVLACDLAIAAEDASFTLAYCHLGVTPDGGATWFLPRLVGLKPAFEIAALGERIEAPRAADLRIINRVVPKDALAEATETLARRLASGPRQALARTKALLNAAFGAPLPDQLRREGESFSRCTLTGDFIEGVSAFVEKRRPTFNRG